MAKAKVFGSQIGGEAVINYGYTDMPFKLFSKDIFYFFYYAGYLPWIVWPIRPCDGGSFDELELTRENIWCLSIHAILIVIQTAFILALPWTFLFPAWIAVAGVALFLAFNKLLCGTLNGSTIIFHSDPEYAPALAEHEHEQWIFINGVAVGEAWLKSNINRLALTFKRPIIGVHNQTSGIIFDVIECLIQRQLGLATRDVREAYKIVKEKLYNPKYSKIIFILHSQGGIEGGLVLDWLLQELPQDLLSKLEVYTFGNASNHFNNPHRFVVEQTQVKRENSTAAADAITRTVTEPITEAPLTDSPVETQGPVPASLLRQQQSTTAPQVNGPKRQVNGPKSQAQTTVEQQRSKPDATATADGDHDHHDHPTRIAVPATHRAIGHVEHYVHTYDFVALWGALHFVTNKPGSPTLPRFIGRVFSRSAPTGGHQFSQHYLNGMFPLARDGSTGKFVGCADSNEFMDTVVEIGEVGVSGGMREGLQSSCAALRRDAEALEAAGVTVHGSFFNLHEKDIRDGKVRVKNLSRLWLYRNGMSPPEIDGNGVIRGLAL
ncbi:hypothetical protein DL769_004085 [Monosporascus sp. CRB-8-3]|nr:hypothetical protein DL769_004085 [Monosporascus sp. CRB-8-3]